MTQIAAALMTLQNKIHTYEKKYQRSSNSVSLLAVSKKQPLEKILAAIAAGQTCFGESYLQEGLAKITALADKKIEWHFIGPIQSNKTKKIAEFFSWVHSVDNLRIAQRLNDQRPPWLPPLNICIEINISGEQTKSGIAPEASAAIIERCLRLPRLTVRGLMTIPAPKPSFVEQRAEFHKMSVLYHTLREKGFMLETLSMGMSDDFEAAIAEGSTIVRIGTAIFGSRI